MDEKSSAIEIKDFIDCLRDENNRLLDQLSFAQKCMKLFEDYRKCLIGFANSCLCDQNFDNQMEFNRLEKNYISLVEEDMRMSAIFADNNIKIGFTKDDQKVSETNEDINQVMDQNEDNLKTIESNEVKVEESCENVLSNKLSDSLKNLRTDEEFRLMYLKNRSDDNSEHFKCNWFQCPKIFASESSLSQHIRSEHFRVIQYSDDWFFSEPQEVVIKSEPEDKTRYYSQNKPNLKRDLEEYVCEWIGCEMEFRTESALRRHQNLCHNRPNRSPVPKNTRFVGLKPLTIHSLDSDTSHDRTSSEKRFECDFCEKSYARKDSLKCHISSEHRSGKGIKMFNCDHCEYETKNNSHMKRHILRKHTNQRPFKCDLGDCHPDIVCFPTLDQLRSHKTNKHPNEVF